VPVGERDLLTDPAGVIAAVISDVDTGLDADTIAGVVDAVAPGRNVQRRLARALFDRPGLLRDGRSPAPRVAGNLLIALRGAGAMHIAAPVCAGCGKTLRTFHRRGEHWYCNTCGARPRQCASCGQERVVASLDRHGRPRCSQCPERDDRDPLAILTAVITGLEPALPAEAVASAIGRVFSRRGNLQHLAWVIEDNPDLLTGEGAHAPTPAVLRLIDELCDAGAQRITRPACSRCQRIIRLHRRIDAGWVCRNCLAKSRAQPCARCGAVREAGSRDEHGRPLCPHCVSTDPVNHETCLACRRRRPVSVRRIDGPLCETCRPVATMTCAICGRSGPAVISKATGQPWCQACRQHRAVCTGCGRLRPVRGGTRAAPRCATCTRPDTSFWHRCPGCGEPMAHRRRRCGRCTLHRRLDDVLRAGTGAVPARLQTLHQHLADHDRPETVLAWLNKDATTRTLRALAMGELALTHGALDELPDDKTLRHLRAVLVATGALPPRDEQIVRLERWITSTVAAHPDAEQRQVLHRYAVWHVLRRLRRRVHGSSTTYGQAVAARRNVNAAIALLTWLSSQGTTLAAARQGDIEAWITGTSADPRTDAGNFVRWANKHKLTRLDFPAVRWIGPTGRIDTETRWTHTRRLLHDDTLNPEDRVAGLLVLLYAQTAAATSRLTLDHVDTAGSQTRLTLGREPVILPEPLAGLVQQLTAQRHGHAALGDQGTNRWLFPGGQPGRPISAFRLTERLRDIGIQAGPARSTALFSLAAELPAALLARLLGIHISVAVTWQRASSGDWTTYAADYSRRTTTTVGTPDRSS
jgi:hypothetical protein